MINNKPSAIILLCLLVVGPSWASLGSWKAFPDSRRHPHRLGHEQHQRQKPRRNGGATTKGDGCGNSNLLKASMTQLSTNATASTDKTLAPPSSSSSSSPSSSYNPLRMYLSCMGIVFAWISTGTIFYAVCNQWPIPQSFFYAVDAGMSIGFCTDVVETKLISKAFTIVFILLGASVVGGALALFIQDSVEGISYGGGGLGPRGKSFGTKEYQLLLEKEVFDKFDVSRTGVLSYDEFRNLLQATVATTSSMPLSDDDVKILWKKFDRLNDGVIHFEEEFAGKFGGIQELLTSLQSVSHNDSVPESTLPTAARPFVRMTQRLCSIWDRGTAPMQAMWKNEDRIYFVFVGWVLLGVVWGMVDQGWDPITATHFAVSALATGGLTAPPVNQDGILPAEPAIFCGLYCLFGIPLMAVTLGHFATTLVSKHVRRMEQYCLTRPMTSAEFELGQSLTRTKTKARTGRRRIKKDENGLHFGDFVVLQLLRQGRLSKDNVETLRGVFERLDKDLRGVLMIDEATNWSSCE